MGHAPLSSLGSRPARRRYSLRYANSAGPVGRRPGLTSHVPTLLSWISTLGSSTIPNRSLAESPVVRPALPQWYGSQIRGHLDEHGRLQLRQVRQGPAHAAGRMVLGEPAGAEHVREHVARGRMQRVLAPLVDLAGRVALLLVQRVGDRRLGRLVV